MSVYRRHKRTDYSVIDNHVFKDKDLTLKAKGLLATILSLPDDWKYSIEGLASLSNDGTTSVSNAINELIKAGYIVRSQSNDDQGRFSGYVYDIYEKPQKPFTENPNTDNSFTDNQQVLNTNISNTNILNTKDICLLENSRKPKFIPPTVEEVRAYCLERGNDVDPVKFVAHYSASNWYRGKTKISNWKQCVITWERNAKERQPKQQSGNMFEDLLREEGYT